MSDEPTRGDQWVEYDDLWFACHEDPRAFVAALRRRGLLQPPPDWKPYRIPRRPLVQPFM